MRAWVAAGAVAGMLFGAVAAAAEAPPATVRIEKVEVVVTDVGPAVLLSAGTRVLPVFVDPTVAESIHAALAGGKPPRPYPHDLMKSVLSAYDGSVTRVAISLKGTTYYADLTVALQGRSQVFDSRASDAIALAVHFQAPIVVERALLERNGIELEAPAAGQRL
jgi:bifunctional DNase/RNase